MDKTASDAQAQKKNKISAKKAEEIRGSRKLAAALKREWEDLARKQEERGGKIAAGRKISSIALTKNRRGKISVRIDMQNGARLLDNDREKNVSGFKEKARAVYFKSKIEELLKKIKEYGYAAVEGEIPAELKEAVLKAMEKANISTSYKGEKAEAEAARQAAQRTAELADNMMKSVLPSSSSAAVPVAAWILPEFENSAFRDKHGIVQTEPPKQRREGSSSTVSGYEMIQPDGSRYAVTLVGSGHNAQLVKMTASAEVIRKQQNGQPLNAVEKALLEKLNEWGIASLEDLQKNSNRMNNLSEKLIPEKYRRDLLEAKILDRKQEELFKKSMEKEGISLSRKSANNVVVPLNLSAGRKIEDVINDERANRNATSKEDKNRKALLAFYCKSHDSDEITPEALKFMRDMEKNKISGKELWKYGKTHSAEEVKSYIDGRCKGDIPPPQKEHLSEAERNRRKAADQKAKEALLAPDNAVSAEKIRQAKAVLNKEAEGKALSAKEQKLSAFIHQTFGKISDLKQTDLENPKNRKQLTAMLQCNKLYSDLPKNEASKQTEKERVAGKIRELRQAYAAAAKPSSAKQGVVKDGNLQQKPRQERRTSTVSAPAPLSPAVRAALLKRKEDLSR